MWLWGMATVALAGEAVDWTTATTVVVGEVVEHGVELAGVRGPIDQNGRLKEPVRIDVRETLRGTPQSERSATYSWGDGDPGEPPYALGGVYLFALSSIDHGDRVVSFVEHVRPLSELQQAREALARPYGDPWKDGREPWLAPGAVLEIEPVPAPPGEPIPPLGWASNPKGDGEFVITVRNPSEAPLTVPALRSSADGTVLWADSLVWEVDERVAPWFGATGAVGDTVPTVLDPGEARTLRVDLLPHLLTEIPSGGHRVFTVGLGEHTVRYAFYQSDHHRQLLRARE